MKRPNLYTLYLCHDNLQSEAEAAAKKAKANEEWYEHNKEWKKEYNQEYYQKNKEYWENYYKEQKSSAERAEENMKRAQQEYADYTKKNSSTGKITNERITSLGDGSIKKTSSSAKTVTGSTTTSSKTTPVTSSTKTASATSTIDKKDYDLSTITKDEMDLANKVIRGDFSVGKKRKELLKKYIEEKKLNLDPVKIQRYVNRLAKVGYNWNKSGIKTPGSSEATSASSNKTSAKSKSSGSTTKTATLKSSTQNKATKSLLNQKSTN